MEGGIDTLPVAPPPPPPHYEKQLHKAVKKGHDIGSSPLGVSAAHGAALTARSLTQALRNAACFDDRAAVWTCAPAFSNANEQPRLGF